MDTGWQVTPCAPRQRDDTFAPRVRVGIFPCPYLKVAFLVEVGLALASWVEIHSARKERPAERHEPRPPSQPFALEDNLAQRKSRSHVVFWISLVLGSAPSSPLAALADPRPSNARSPRTPSPRPRLPLSYFPPSIVITSGRLLTFRLVRGLPFSSQKHTHAPFIPRGATLAVEKTALGV